VGTPWGEINRFRQLTVDIVQQKISGRQISDNRRQQGKIINRVGQRIG
jgi:hypothetical protein